MFMLHHINDKEGGAPHKCWKLGPSYLATLLPHHRSDPLLLFSLLFYSYRRFCTSILLLCFFISFHLLFFFLLSFFPLSFSSFSCSWFLRLSLVLLLRLLVLFHLLTLLF